MPRMQSGASTAAALGMLPGMFWRMNCWELHWEWQWHCEICSAWGLNSKSQNIERNIARVVAEDVPENIMKHCWLWSRWLWSRWLCLGGFGLGGLNRVGVGRIDVFVKDEKSSKMIRIQGVAVARIGCVFHSLKTASSASRLDSG